jgi:uncharacterized membrane protein
MTRGIRLSALTLPRLLFSVVLFFGVCLAFIMPPIQAPDENSHFTRAVLVSFGRFTGDAQGCQKAPESLVQYVGKHQYMMGRADQKYGYSQWYPDSQAPLNMKPTVVDCYSAQSASPLMYLPPAAGILAARGLYAISPLRTLGFNWPAALYFARLGNLLAFAIAAAVACAWASRFSSIIFAVSTLPMTLQAAASSSYDATTIMVCLLFFALVVRIATAARAPQRRETIGLVVLAFFVAHSKIVYAPMILMIVALKRWMDWPSFLRLALYLALGGLAGVALTMVIGISGDAKSAALQHQQVQYLLSHPRLFWRLAPDTLHVYRDFYTISLLGNFGWLDSTMAMPALMLLWATLLCAVAIDALRGPSPLGWLASGATLFAATVSVVGLVYVVYIIWTSLTLGVGTATAGGIQGRYFIPLAPFVMAAVAASPRRLADRAAGLRLNLMQAQVTTVLALLALTLFTLMLRYWIPETPH